MARAAWIPEKTSPDELRERLLCVSEWLLDGQPQHEMVALAMARWSIERRTAQVYLQKARRRLAAQAAREDRMFYLRLSQMQRDRLMRLVFRHMEIIEHHTPQKLRALTGLVAATCRLLDSRDQTATAIHRMNGFEERPARPGPTPRRDRPHRRPGPLAPGEGQAGGAQAALAR